MPKFSPKAAQTERSWSLWLFIMTTSGVAFYWLMVFFEGVIKLAQATHGQAEDLNQTLLEMAVTLLLTGITWVMVHKTQRILTFFTMGLLLLLGTQGHLFYYLWPEGSARSSLGFLAVLVIVQAWLYSDIWRVVRNRTLKSTGVILGLAIFLYFLVFGLELLILDWMLIMRVYGWVGDWLRDDSGLKINIFYWDYAGFGVVFNGLLSTVAAAVGIRTAKQLQSRS